MVALHKKGEVSRACPNQICQINWIMMVVSCREPLTAHWPYVRSLDMRKFLICLRQMGEVQSNSNAASNCFEIRLKLVLNFLKQTNKLTYNKFYRSSCSWSMKYKAVKCLQEWSWSFNTNDTFFFWLHGLVFRYHNYIYIFLLSDS